MSKEPKESRHKDAHERRRSLEETILDLCAAAGAQKSIDPIEAAKAFSQSRGEEDDGWRNWLHHVRSAAIGLARQGKLVIYRKVSLPTRMIFAASTGWACRRATDQGAGNRASCLPVHQ